MGIWWCAIELTTVLLAFILLVMASRMSPVDYLETEIEKELKWKKVEEIKNFPLKNFEEAKEKINSNEFSLALDYTTSNILATWLYGKKYALFMAALGYTPYIGALLSIILAVVFKNFWLLFGIPICVLGEILSNPHLPKRTFYQGVANFLTVVFVLGLITQQETTIYLAACYIFPFWINRYYYWLNQSRLIEVALNSEKVFIYFYQTGKLGLRNNTSGESFWDSEALLENYRQLFNNPRWPAK